MVHLTELVWLCNACALSFLAVLGQKTLACAPHSKAGKDGAGREALVTLQHMYKAAMTSASEGMQGGTGSLGSLATLPLVLSPLPSLSFRPTRNDHRP